MKRDMDLIRKILIKIEEEYQSTAIYDLSIDGYDRETVAYHCNLLYEEKLISDYASQYGDDSLCFFAVGHLTWEGHDLLDKIRDDSQWGKVKDTIKQKGLPLILDTIKAIATALVTAATEGAVNSITKNGIAP